jgi:23S rRNA (uracil1939-C5)-methyltransferase
LQYGFLSFFQINVPLFEHALGDMAQFVNKGDKVVDFYSGVGAISIPLSSVAQSSSLVDSNADAIGHAKLNIRLNGLNTYTAACAPAERTLEAITPDCTLIMDPPRAGLHTNVIKKIIKEQPPRILYMSCDGSTHSRDISFLLPWYEITFFKLYNFFPRTPHVEALCVLERRQK